MVDQKSFGAGLARKLNHLFARVRLSGGNEYSNEQVAAAIRAGGVTISQSYIWQLRQGRKDNPTYRHLEALAGFFGVPVSYFFEDATTDRVDEQLTQLKAEQERLREIANGSDVQVMAMRAGELSQTGRRQVKELIDFIYLLERNQHGGTASTR
ncbi:XRE family transcriptional regulator [Solihabitans fulvus]|uniref:XRE family transcriptional regulator n=1 Tax=Solihabitans fulvus TaxID=1892852 RepID=A0A5B2WCK0_9PSEU|nr:helix-turn-helix domain-containing protein [Solihabitans fulvus]KAA2249541.1 XRE family transcriptional regulator [Solihabitans fulvus]